MKKNNSILKQTYTFVPYIIAAIIIIVTIIILTKTSINESFSQYINPCNSWIIQSDLLLDNKDIIQTISVDTNPIFGNHQLTNTTHKNIFINNLLNNHVQKGKNPKQLFVQSYFDSYNLIFKVYNTVNTPTPSLFKSSNDYYSNKDLSLNICTVSQNLDNPNTFLTFKSGICVSANTDMLNYLIPSYYTIVHKNTGWMIHNDNGTAGIHKDNYQFDKAVYIANAKNYTDNTGSIEYDYFIYRKNGSNNPKMLIAVQTSSNFLVTPIWVDTILENGISFYRPNYEQNNFKWHEQIYIWRFNRQSDGSFTITVSPYMLNTTYGINRNANGAFLMKAVSTWTRSVNYLNVPQPYYSHLVINSSTNTQQKVDNGLDIQGMNLFTISNLKLGDSPYPETISYKNQSDCQGTCSIL